MDKFQEMTTFVAVVDAGSFVGAGEATGQSKAAVSRHVADLERRLGVRLLHRSTRRLSLTAEGQAFVERCRETLSLLDEAESEITQDATEARGRIRVNAPLTFGVTQLAPLWGRFLDAHPNVTLEVSLSDRIVDLLDEGFDLAIRISRLANSQLVSRQLSSTRMMLCASPGYLARHGTPRHPRELTHHQVISYSHWATRDEWQFDGPDGPVSVRLKPRMHADNGDTCVAAALADQGIVLQPSFICAADVRRGALVELMQDYKSFELGIHAVYPSRRLLPSRVRLLIDFLVEQLRDRPW